MDHRSLLALVAAVSFAACGTGPSVPRTGPGPGNPADPTPQQITGTERIWWNQTAGDPAEIIRLRYAAYVDGTRSELSDSSCTAGQDETAFECSSSLPPMSPGIHTIQLAAYFAGFEALESARSAPIRGRDDGRRHRRVSPISRARAGDPARAAKDPVPLTLPTTDGIRLRVELVADGLAEPTDFAFAPGGRIFVAERAGRIRLLRNGVLRPASAATLSETTTLGGGGILGLAVDPQFERNRFVYAVHTTPAGDNATAFRVVRLRETNETLVDPVVLLDGVPASGTGAAASVRFGPDGKLYVALDDGGNPRLTGDLASFSGKILRMNADGSTPDDQAAATPVYSSDYRSPRGLAWQPGSGTLWVGDSPRPGSLRLAAVVAVEGRPRRARTVTAVALSPPTGAAGMCFYGGRLIPALQNDLLVAATPGGHILRFRFDSRNPLSIVAIERLPDYHVGGVRAIAIGPDEAVYVCTERALARLVPDGRR